MEAIKAIEPRAREIAQAYLNMVNKSPSPYHVVDWARSTLSSKGFTEIHETDFWKLEVGGKYFLTKNNTTLVAFAIGTLPFLYETLIQSPLMALVVIQTGKKFSLTEGGFKIIGTHTDSPNLRLAPISKLTDKDAQVEQLCIQTYGGGLWHTWFDRDLTLAGRVVYRAGPDAYASKLFHYPK